jgi:cell division protein ZapA
VSQQKIEIILGEKTLKIACPPGEESALNYAADDLNKRLVKARNTHVITTPEQTMLMTALNLSYDLLKTQALLVQERKESPGDLVKSEHSERHVRQNEQRPRADPW